MTKTYLESDTHWAIFWPIKTEYANISLWFHFNKIRKLGPHFFCPYNLVDYPSTL